MGPRDRVQSHLGTTLRARRLIELVSLLGVALFVGLWLRDWGGVLPRLPGSPMITALDYHILIDATRRFLGGGSFYDPRQLSGPYGWDGGVQGWWPILYPPASIALFAPFTVLPAVLWWVIPLGITAAVVAWHRPGPVAWPLLAICLWWPVTTAKIVTGNPVMWAVAFVALGTVWRWPAALTLFKPSLFPFALIGVRDRRWWLASGLVVLLFCWLLPEYVRAISFFSEGIVYSLGEMPMLAIPIIAWVGSSRRAGMAQPWRSAPAPIGARPGISLESR